MKLLPFMKENINFVIQTCFFRVMMPLTHAKLWSQKRHLWSLMDSLEGPFGNMTILQVEMAMVKGVYRTARPQ